MGIINRKITAFTKTLSQRPNKERNQGTNIKATIDSSPEELRVALNGAIDDIITDYETKANLTTNRKLSVSGDFTGTWNTESKDSIDSKISTANTNSQNALTNTMVLENQFNQLIINAGNSNAEVVAARVMADGTAFDALPDRLNFIDLNLSGSVDVKSPPASLAPVKADGTDETAKIQNILNYVATKNGKIYFPEGTYRFGKITIPVGIKMFIGAGIGKTIFKPIGTLADYDGLVYSQSVSDVDIGNFEIQMDTTTYSTNKGIYLASVNNVYCSNILIDPAGAFGLYSGESKDLLIERVIVKNFGTAGMRHEGATSKNIITKNCRVIGVGTNHGIQNIGGSFHKILNCYGENCKPFAFNLKSVGGGTIAGNTTLNTYAEGVNIDNSNQCVVGNNICIWDDLHGNDFGISVYGDSSSFEKALNNIVSNNIIMKCKKSGIALADDVSGTIVSNNIIYNANQLNEAQGAGILLYGAAGLNTITGNTIRDDSGKTKYGINEFDDPSFSTNPDYNYVQNNTILNYVTSPISLQNNHSKKSGGYPVTWDTYTPTITAASGTFTSVSATGRYRVEGNTCYISIVATITTNGTAAGAVYASLPKNSNDRSIISGREDGTSGKMLQGEVTTVGLIILNYDGTYPGANGAILKISGQYEIA